MTSYISPVEVSSSTLSVIKNFTIYINVRNKRYSCLFTYSNSVYNASTLVEIKSEVDVPTKISQLENDANYIQDANYIHTDNNFTTALKNQLADLNSEYLNIDNKNNYVKSRRFFAKAFENIDAPWGFMRYLNNVPELTDSTVKVTAIRSDFNGNALDNSYVTIPAATQKLAGVMSAADKKRLDAIVDFQLPETIIYAMRPHYEASYMMLVYDIMYPDGTPDSDTISFNGATTTKAGLLTAADKVRLDNALLVTGGTMSGVLRLAETTSKGITTTSGNGLVMYMILI